MPSSPARTSKDELFPSVAADGSSAYARLKVAARVTSTRRGAGLGIVRC